MGGVVASVLHYTSKEVEHIDIAKARQIKAHSVEVRDPENPKTESRIRRSPLVAPDEDLNKKFSSPEFGTIVGIVKSVCSERPSQSAMAWRPVEKIEKVEVTDEKGLKKMMDITHLKPTQYLTYAELWKTIVAFGNGLAKLGIGSGWRVGIYEDTRKEWLISAIGGWTQGVTLITVYANLGEDALIYAVKEAELPVMILNGKAVGKFLSLCKTAKIKVPLLIYIDEIPHGVDTAGAKTVSWDKVVGSGKEMEEKPYPKDPSAVALITYTSGTTGDPKGIVASHSNILACMLCFQTVFNGWIPPEPELRESYACFLPLAHTLEFSAEVVFLCRGALLGYANPRTLTNATAKPHGDLQEYKPVFLIGVPRIFDTIKKAIEGKLPASGVKRAVFDRAYEDRRIALQKGLDTPTWNNRVFTNTRDLLGGKCKLIISGGAPLSGALQEFMRIVFGCSVAQGYGLTETCSCCSLEWFHSMEKENVGMVVDAVEVKLRDAEAFGYTHNDKPNPRGEVCIRGPPVTVGYYKQPEKTKEAYDPNGWFYTGDVGEFQPNGTLKIVGRVKEIAKNAHGEYVAYAALESIYVLNELVVPNGCCVLVHPMRSYIAAIVLTDEAKATKFATQSGIRGKWPEFLQNEEFHKKAAVSLAETAKFHGKRPFELVKVVRVLNEEWTPENGVLTAAMKLKRRVIDEKYAELIKQLFLKEQ